MLKYNGAMRTKTSIHKAFVATLARGVSQKRIADESGVPQSSLKQFRHSSSLGEKNLRLLETWLDANPEYWRPAQEVPNDLARLLAKDLRGVADWLESPEVPHELKLSRFFQFVDEAQASREQIVQGFQIPKK